MTRARPGGWNWLWAALVLAGLLVFYAIAQAPTTPSKPHVFSIDQMVDICTNVSGQARRAAGHAAGEKSYDDCMARLIREATESR